MKSAKPHQGAGGSGNKLNEPTRITAEAANLNILPDKTASKRSSSHRLANKQQNSTNIKQQDREIPKQLLEKIAQDVLNHSKQLGLFDELRMKLLENIESSQEFYKIRREFNLEVKELCQRADLGLSRAKLRDKLNDKNLARSANKLKDHVQQVSREHKYEVKRVYKNHAIDFLVSRNKKIEEEQQEQLVEANRVIVELEKTHHEEELQIEEEIKKAAERCSSVKCDQSTPDQQKSYTSTSSSSTSSRADSFADSGVASITPPSQGTPVNGTPNLGATTPNSLLLLTTSALQSIIITDPDVLSEIPLPPSPSTAPVPENCSMNDQVASPEQNQLLAESVAITRASSEVRYNFVADLDDEGSKVIQPFGSVGVIVGSTDIEMSISKGRKESCDRKDNQVDNRASGEDNDRHRNKYSRRSVRPNNNRSRSRKGSNSPAPGRGKTPSRSSRSPSWRSCSTKRPQTDVRKQVNERKRRKQKRAIRPGRSIERDNIRYRASSRTREVR